VVSTLSVTTEARVWVFPIREHRLATFWLSSNAIRISGGRQLRSCKSESRELEHKDSKFPVNLEKLIILNFLMHENKASHKLNFSNQVINFSNAVQWTNSVSRRHMNGTLKQRYLDVVTTLKKQNNIALTSCVGCYVIRTLDLWNKSRVEPAFLSRKISNHLYQHILSTYCHGERVKFSTVTSRWANLYKIKTKDMLKW